MVSFVESYLVLILSGIISWIIFSVFFKGKGKKSGGKMEVSSISTQTGKIDPVFLGRRDRFTQTDVTENIRNKEVVEDIIGREVDIPSPSVEEKEIVRHEKQESADISKTDSMTRMEACGGEEEGEVESEKKDIEKVVKPEKETYRLLDLEEMREKPEETEGEVIRPDSLGFLMDSNLSFDDPIIHSPARKYDDDGLFDRIGVGETLINRTTHRDDYLDSILIDEDEADIDSEGEGEVEEGWEVLGGEKGKTSPFDDSDDEEETKIEEEEEEGEDDDERTKLAKDNLEFLTKSVILDLEEKKKRKIDHILREMRTTEESFMNDLNRVHDRYIVPLKRQSGVIKNAKIFSMFAKLGIIRNISMMFLEDLKKVISMTESNVERIDEISITIYSFSQAFKLYADYVTGFNDFNIEIGDMLLHNKKFSGFCHRVNKDLMKENSRIKDLPSFLITPIQRIPRLNLMMRDLLRIVGTDFKEHENLAKAAKIIGDMARYSNDKTRETKNLERIRVIEKELRMTNLIQPHRKLLTEIVVERIRKSGKVLKSHVALFSDILIVYPVKRPIDLTFTMFKEPYICDLTDPTVKVRLIDEETLSVDYRTKEGVVKNIVLGFQSGKEGIEFYKLVCKQVKKKRVAV